MGDDPPNNGASNGVNNGSNGANNGADIAERQLWMSVLAKADLAELEAGVKRLGKVPEYRFLRSPEVGLAMVRSRAGGTGAAFNLGEMTLTRCVVCLEPTELAAEPAESADLDTGFGAGFGYVAGRSCRHAELAALCDALLQRSHWHSRVISDVVAPLQASFQHSAQQQQQQTAATQVEFFTMLRGES